MTSATAPRLKPLTPKQIKDYVEATEAMRERWIKRVHSAVTQQLNPTYRVLNDNLQSDSPHALAARVARTLSAQTQDWTDLLTSIAQQVGEAFAHEAVKELAERLGVDGFDTSNRMYRATRDTFISNYCAQLVPVRVARIQQGISNRVARKIGQMFGTKALEIKDGGDVAVAEPEMDYGEADDEFQAMFGNFATYIAESETVLASNLGPLAGVVGYSAAMGVELVKMWSAVGDDRTRRTHDDADGQTQLLSDPFEVGGSELMFPMDESMGASFDETEHCRCVETFDTANTNDIGPSSNTLGLDEEAAAALGDEGSTVEEAASAVEDANWASAEATTVRNSIAQDLDSTGVLTSHADPSPPLPSRYTPKETVAKIESWLKQEYPHMATVELTGLPPGVANQLASEYVRLADLYPEVAGRVKYMATKSSDFMAEFAKLYPKSAVTAIMDKPALMAADHTTGMFLYINDLLLSDPEIMAIQREAAMAGFMPDGTGGSVYSLVSHEWGHLMEAWYRSNPLAAGNVDRLLALPFKGSDISLYARTLAEEQWAEAFAASQYGTETVQESAYVQAMMDFIDKGTAYMRTLK